MFQLARHNQRRHETTFRSSEPALDRSPALAPGKRALTDAMNAAFNGTPDYYTRAVDSAIRELEAIRSTALATYVSIRRKQNMNPLARQIELAKSAMQVRHMILTANCHVYALEKAATHVNPMVLWLRARMDRVVAQATKLGVYDDAMDMLPQRFIDDTKQKNGTNRTHNVKPAKTAHEPPPAGEGTRSPTMPASVRKPANTARRALPRAARGTRPITTLQAPSSGGAPSEPRSTSNANGIANASGIANANVRPGFRPGAR